jgi:hypothetical protein
VKTALLVPDAVDIDLGGLDVIWLLVAEVLAFLHLVKSVFLLVGLAEREPAE